MGAWAVEQLSGFAFYTFFYRFILCTFGIRDGATLVIVFQIVASIMLIRAYDGVHKDIFAIEQVKTNARYRAVFRK
jgi:hypothetical protein